MANLTPGQRKQLARFNGTVASAIIDKAPYLSASAPMALLEMCYVASRGCLAPVLLHDIL
jgi:hypothetical protein